MLKFDDATTKLLDQAYLGADFARRRRYAFDALSPAPGDTLVDLGCGTGLFLTELARAVGPDGCVIGVEPSADMRAVAAERCAGMPHVTVETGEAGRLPLEDTSVDGVVAVQVLEYVDDIPAAMAEIYRVLRPGGRWVAVDTGLHTLEWASDDPDRMARIVAAWDHHYVESSVAHVWAPSATAAGFGMPTVTPCTFVDTTLRPDGIAFLLLTLMRHYAVQEGHVPEQEAQAWYDEQVARARDGRFFFSLTYFCMSALKI